MPEAPGTGATAVGGGIAVPLGPSEHHPEAACRGCGPCVTSGAVRAAGHQQFEPVQDPAQSELQGLVPPAVFRRRGQRRPECGEPLPVRAHHLAQHRRELGVRTLPRGPGPGSLLRAYAQERQKGGDRTGRFLAPSSKLGLRLRNTVLSRPRVLAWMLKAAKEATTLALPDYPDYPDRTVNSPSEHAH